LRHTVRGRGPERERSRQREAERQTDRDRRKETGTHTQRHTHVHPDLLSNPALVVRSGDGGEIDSEAQMMRHEYDFFQHAQPGFGGRFDQHAQRQHVVDFCACV
jgi:hypothetical protein